MPSRRTGVTAALLEQLDLVRDLIEDVAPPGGVAVQAVRRLRGQVLSASIAARTERESADMLAWVALQIEDLVYGMAVDIVSGRSDALSYLGVLQHVREMIVRGSSTSSPATFRGRR